MLTYAGLLVPVALVDSAGNAQGRQVVDVLNLDGTPADVYADPDRTPLTGAVASDPTGNVSEVYAEPGMYRLRFSVLGVAYEVVTVAPVDPREVSELEESTDARLVDVEDTLPTLLPASQKGAVDGVASLDSGGHIPDTQIPATIARDAEVTAAVNAAVTALLAGAPGAFDTLNELATALQNGESAAAALTAAVALKAPLVSPALTGTPTKNGSPLLSQSDAAGTYSTVVNHGSTAGTARPSGAAVVEWYGSVAPTNASSGDRWWDTVNELWKRYTGAAWVASGSTAYVTNRPEWLHVAKYATLADLFTARDAIAGPAVIEFDGATHSGAGLRIDKADTVIKGNGGKIILPAGADQDALKVGVDAFRLKIKDLDLAGDCANQTGTSRGIHFEPYSDVPFRYADRARLENLNIDGFLSDGVVIGASRKAIDLYGCYIRDFARYGIDVQAPDGKIVDCEIGGIRAGSSYGVRVDSGGVWLTGTGLYSCRVAGLLMTQNAVGCLVMDNQFENNYGGGIRAVGSGGSSLWATIGGNKFRANSREGDGVHSDIYLDQVADLTLSHNQAWQETGSPSRTKYVVEGNAGLSSISSVGNAFSSTYPTLGRWNTTAAAARSTRSYSIDLIADGSADATIRRQGTGMEVTTDFTGLGLVAGQRVSVAGTAGNGYVIFTNEQSSDPAAPSANRAVLFIRDNGSGKTELCTRFNTGAVQVIKTEP